MIDAIAYAEKSVAATGRGPRDGAGEIAVDLAGAVDRWTRAEDRRRAMDAYGHVPTAVCEAVLDARDDAEDDLRELIRRACGGSGRAALVGGKLILDLEGLEFDEGGVPTMIVIDAGRVAVA